MKALVIAAACLLLATHSSGECVEVTSANLELPTVQASSRRVGMTTLQDGKALGKVRVVFYRPTDEVNPRRTLTTDKQGVILARALPRGHDRIFTIGPEPESAEGAFAALRVPGDMLHSFRVRDFSSRWSASKSVPAVKLKICGRSCALDFAQHSELWERI